MNTKPTSRRRFLRTMEMGGALLASGQTPDITPNIESSKSFTILQMTLMHGIISAAILNIKKNSTKCGRNC